MYEGVEMDVDLNLEEERMQMRNLSWIRKNHGLKNYLMEIQLAEQVRMLDT